MHIVLTVNASWNIWNFRRPLVSALLADGHQVTVLAPIDETAAQLRDMGCEVVPLELNRKGLNPVADLLLIARFAAHFRKLDPDIVLGFTIKNNIYGALAAKWCGIPFAPNVTGLGTAFLSSRVLQTISKGLYRTAFRHCPSVFFQNADDLDLFVSDGLVTAHQARLLPGSGIDLSEYAMAPLPSSEEPVTFLMIARLLRDKGVEEYAAAAQTLKPRISARFLLLGPFDENNRSAISPEDIAKWEATGGIEYLGTSDDVRRIIRDAHCVVLPSYREGAPRTLIEAAAMGRPLIATDVPGCRSVVDDGTNGYLCRVRDSAALADGMEAFAKLPAIAKIEMGQASRQKMEDQFSVNLVITAYREVIETATTGSKQLS